MKKKVLSLALLAIAVSSVNAMAQTEQKDVKAAQAKELKCDKQEKSDKQNGPYKPRRGADMLMEMFSGIELTDSQKEQITALNEQYMVESRASKNEMRDNKAKETRDAVMQQRDQERKNFLSNARKILGDEKYIQFLENNFQVRYGKAPGNNRFNGAVRNGKPAMMKEQDNVIKQN